MMEWKEVNGGTPWQKYKRIQKINKFHRNRDSNYTPIRNFETRIHENINNLREQWALLDRLGY